MSGPNMKLYTSSVFLSSVNSSDMETVLPPSLKT